MSLFNTDVLPEAPETAEEFSHRGWAYYVLGEIENAEKDFRTALDKDRNHVDAAYGLALACKRNGRADEWRPLFERVLQLLEAGHLNHNRPRAVILRHTAQTQLTYLPEKDWTPDQE